jgi:hypothetical protein
VYGVGKRFAMRSSTGKSATLMVHTNSAPGLASPMPHRRRGTGLTAATSVPGLCFEWPPSHLSKSLRWILIPVRVAKAFRRNIHNQHQLIGPSLRAIRALRHLIVACYGSPPVGVRPWDEFTNGTPAANIAYLAFVLPRTAYSTFYQDAFSCRILSSAVGKQSKPLAAPAGRVPKKTKKRPMG